MRFLRRCTPIVVAAAALSVPASASAAPALQQVGSFDRPTYVTSDPRDPNRLFVVEQPGRIQLVEGGTTSTFLDIQPLVDYGLLSMAFSPHYASNHLFYVIYAGVDGDWHLDEFHVNGDSADPASRRDVLTIDYPPNPFHFGGQLQFGPDGYLYASTGDGTPEDVQGDPDGNAQNLQIRLGKILRIDPQGSANGEYIVPVDNPFAGTAGCADGCDEIWSYGMRNPWRFSFDRLTGDLVIGDVGSDSWEEIDFETVNLGRGDNLGWNCREGAHPGPGAATAVCAAREGTFTDPVFEYPHNSYTCSSVTGGYVVRDRALADLYGRYLYGDFCTGELRSLQLGLPTASGDRSEGVPFIGRFTSFGEDADCRIYIVSLLGPVYRLTEPVAGPTVGCPPTSSSPGEALTLHMWARRQRLRKRLTFFAKARADSTLVASGKAIRRREAELAANEKTRVRVKLKRAMREQLQKKLATKGKAKVKVIGTATDQNGATATDRIRVKLKD
jgi:hypothetical protein